MSLRRLPLVLLLPLACGPGLSGGSTDSGEPTGGPTAPADLEQACALLFSRRVDYDERCTGWPFPAAEAQPFVESCVGIATAPGAQLEIAEITACADQLAGACVIGTGETYPGCVGDGPDLLYPNHDRPGSAAPGAPCFAQLQCASGYCSAGPDACGACQRARKLGEGCGEANDRCVDASCIDGLCALPGVHEGETCVDYGGGDCQSTLYCRSEGDVVMGVCTARGQLGDGCSLEDECATDLYCDGAVCIERLAEGSDCAALPGACAASYCIGGVCGYPDSGLDVGGDCSVDDCRLDLICTDVVCQAYHVVEEGGACESGMVGGGCVPGLYCDHLCDQGACGDVGVCRVLPGVGETCGFLGDCAVGSVCQDIGFDEQNQQTGVCAPRGGTGEPCPCDELLTCVDGQCTPYGAALCP